MEFYPDWIVLPHENNSLRITDEEVDAFSGLNIHCFAKNAKPGWSLSDLDISSIAGCSESHGIASACFAIARMIKTAFPSLHVVVDASTHSVRILTDHQAVELERYRASVSKTCQRL